MPPFKMTLSKEQVEGKEALPEGIYKVRFIKFSPKSSKDKGDGSPRSINLNAEYEVTDSPEFAGRKIFEIANMKSYNIQTEICHGFGVPLEVDPADGSYYIPGTWDNRTDFNPDNPETFEYKGPLTGKIAQIELGITTYNGRNRNQVRRYFCAIDDCANKFPEIRHQTNLIS
jgi:hypothetical protein